METNKKENQMQDGNQNQGFFAQPRIALSKDGEYLLHFLPGNMIVRKHINLYKKILGIPFASRSAAPSAESAG